MPVTKESMTALSRRRVLSGMAAVPLVSIGATRGRAAEFVWKYATGQDPTHPVNLRAAEAIARIREATGGRVEISLFPANQLGSDTDLISQVRNGSVEILNISASVLATLVPSCGMLNTGFAFPDYDHVWKAMDGAFGDLVRAQIAKSGLFVTEKIWNNGFRQISSSTRKIDSPDSIKGFKIRVPVAPMLTSLFQSLGASPTPINFNEVYSALQTKIVEGQENALPLIYTTKLYEVQTSISMTDHVWDGFWVVGNRRAFAGMPADLRDIVVNEINKSAIEQRQDVVKLSDSLRGDLRAKGITFVDVDRAAFRDTLRKSGFYKNWQAKFGDELWNKLQDVVGPL
ncbi:TRAP transporter substrate-binding protein [Methylobacterium sp. 4-46]|uniref:TRAP transporter substrate-binding protein n=2 Tax=Methylobacterium TaxID=407 RepID=UPI000325585B|nr:TRAP transporter substrate-binding protein [Methylobacterium sp. 4-46]